VTESAVTLDTCEPDSPLEAQAAKRPWRMRWRGRCVWTRPEDNRRSSHPPRKWGPLPRKLSDGRDTASRWSRCLPGVIRNPIHLDWKFRGNLEEPERVGSSISALGDLRGRVRFGDERSTTGSSTVPRKRVTRLGPVQTVVAPSAGRTKAQGRMTGCSGTATWSNATGSITDEYPEVERVRGAASSGK
jgi:hypothetical protein